MMKKTLPLLLSAAVLVGCNNAIPDNKQTYIGDWRSDDMSLLIMEEGDIKYKRQKGKSSTSVKGPIRRFEGDDFIVGVPFVSTTFVVSQPPYKENGQWVMVVDGVKLVKVK